MRNNQHSEHGQALIIIVLGMIALIGVTALAIDGGNALSERRRAQNAADAAALAGALERINNNTSTWVSAVYASAKENGYNNDGTTNIVKVYSPPITGPYTGNIEYIQVQITSYTKTYFAGAVGMPVITNSVEAVSRTTTPTYQPMFGGAMVVSLATTSDCDSNKAFYVHEEATLSIIGGSGIFVNSNNKDCALIQQGEGSIRLNGGKVLLVGGATIQKQKLITPYPPITGVGQAPYPPPFYMPNVTCGREAQISEDGHSMTSGYWNDNFPPPGVRNLGSGTYCLNSDFFVGDNLQLHGNSVTFKIEHGSVRFSNSSLIDLSAPQKGDLAGLLIYQPADNTSTMALNAAENSRVQGSILAPGAQIRIKGNNSSYGFHSQIIGYTIDVGGNSNIIMQYVEDQNYLALSVPEIQFSK